MICHFTEQVPLVGWSDVSPVVCRILYYFFFLPFRIVLAAKGRSLLLVPLTMLASRCSETYSDRLPSVSSAQVSKSEDSGTS